MYICKKKNKSKNIVYNHYIIQFLRENFCLIFSNIVKHLFSIV